MTIGPGIRIGPYELGARLGAGGMGEVFRARDTRLGRTVAIKVLPESLRGDAERLRRFEQEARATGALSHPNLITVFDVGEHDGTPYLVTELLEGRSLREVLAAGPIPARRVVGYAAQIAQGLAAAHEQGIVHRDLKPDNLFVNADDRVKILDFGIAKLTTVATDVTDVAHGSTLAPATGSGMVIGTPGYMAPEQLAGRDVDHRADIFAFGLVLYEMLSGRRAFVADTGVELSYAILKEEPAALPPGLASPALERLILRCLDKRPERRFQSASDLAFNLEALELGTANATVAQVATTTSLAPVPARRGGARLRTAALVLGAALTGALVAGLVMPPPRRAAPAVVATPAGPPQFQRLTFRGGSVGQAGFSPDGKTAYFDAEWGGEPAGIWAVDLATPWSMRRVQEHARLADVSSTGELAMILQPPAVATSTLARLVPGAGAARPIAEGVEWASWAPDGELAIARQVDGLVRLEYPVGAVLWKAERGYLSDLEVSPDGKQVAFLDHPAVFDSRGTLAVVDLAGAKRDVTGPLDDVSGLAWSADGRELWFSSAASDPALTGVLATTLDGRLRVLAHAPGMIHITDVGVDGRALVVQGEQRISLWTAERGQPAREQSWLNGTGLQGLTADGARLSFIEGAGAGQTAEGYGLYVRDRAGGDPVMLGRGFTAPLLPDGSAVLVTLAEPGGGLAVLPTGAGTRRVLPRGPIAHYDLTDRPTASLDGKRIAFRGSLDGQPFRLWVQDLVGGDPRPVGSDAPPAGRPHPLSPDGARLISYRDDGVPIVVPADGDPETTPPEAVPGTTSADSVLGFAADGAHLFVMNRRGWPRQIDRVVLATGAREPWHTIVASDGAGPSSHVFVAISADGAVIAHSVVIWQRHLYLLGNVR